MNKKFITLIIGLLLILIGLLGWTLFNRANKIDDTNIEDIDENISKEEVIEEENNVSNEVVVTEESKNLQKEIKINKVSLPAKTEKAGVVENTIEKETPVLEESVMETKTLEDPYVDENGNIVVQNEFRPHLKEKIFFRGALYTIKTNVKTHSR